jgi:hypothetical protein
MICDMSLELYLTFTLSFRLTGISRSVLRTALSTWACMIPPFEAFPGSYPPPLLDFHLLSVYKVLPICYGSRCDLEMIVQRHMSYPTPPSHSMVCPIDVLEAAACQRALNFRVRQAGHEGLPRGSEIEAECAPDTELQKATRRKESSNHTQLRAVNGDCPFHNRRFQHSELWSECHLHERLDVQYQENVHRQELYITQGRRSTLHGNCQEPLFPMNTEMDSQDSAETSGVSNIEC